MQELNCKQEEEKSASRYNNNYNNNQKKNVSSAHSLNFKTISTTLLAQGPLNHTILNTYTVYTRQKKKTHRSKKNLENQNTDHCRAVCCAITLSTCCSYIASCRRLLSVVEKAKCLFGIKSECVSPACRERTSGVLRYRAVILSRLFCSQRNTACSPHLWKHFQTSTRQCSNTKELCDSRTGPARLDTLKVQNVLFFGGTSKVSAVCELV